MKMSKSLTQAIMLCLIASTPLTAIAASDDECGIWICAPLGFAPEDCAGPHRAMIRRLHKLQP